MKENDCAILQRERMRLRNITAHAQIHRINEWAIIKYARVQEDLALGEGMLKGLDLAMLQREKIRLRNITAHAQIH